MKKTSNKTQWCAVAISVALLIACMVLADRQQKASAKVTTPIESGISVDPADSVIADYEWRLYRLASAMAEVESGNNPHARNGQYVGWLQISPVMVREANRLLGFEAYYLTDRETIEGSLAIFGTIMAVYNPDLDVRTACKVWNKHAGEAYYQRIRNIYDVIGEEGGEE